MLTDAQLNTRVTARVLPFESWYDLETHGWDGREKHISFRLGDAVDAGLADAIRRARAGETVEIILPRVGWREELMLVVEPEAPVWGGVDITLVDSRMAWAGDAGIGSTWIMAVVGECLACEYEAEWGVSAVEYAEHTCNTQRPYAPPDEADRYAPTSEPDWDDEND